MRSAVMESVLSIKLPALLCLAMSHGPFVGRLVARLRRSEMPDTRELVIVSFLLYYDLGVFLEACGAKYVDTFFSPIFIGPDRIQALTFLIVIVSPWIIDWAARKSHAPRLGATDRKSALRPSRRRAFYAVTCIVSLGCVALAAYLALHAVDIWVARGTVSDALGPFIISLLLPAYFLAFYVRQSDSHTLFGKLFLCFLTACSMAAAAPMGERTFVLLPFVIITLFWVRISLRRLLIAGTIGVMGAALLLPFFKLQEAGNEDNFELLVSTLNGDLARMPVLEDVLSRSRLVGTKVLNYPGVGYVYSAFYFVPRSLAPFKGSSTAVAYTGYKTEQSTDQVDWGLGVGAIEELLLNFGILLLPLGLMAYGLALRQLDRASERIPALLAPTRLTGVFFLGYHLPAMLQDFGAMALVALLLHGIFAEVEIVTPEAHAVSS